MEEFQTLVQSALQSLGAVQTLAIAGAAGIVMRGPNQILYMTLIALGVDQVVRLARLVVSEEMPVGALTSTKWSSFLSMPMSTFLASLISFGLVISLAYSLKSMLKRV